MLIEVEELVKPS